MILDPDLSGTSRELAIALVSECSQRTRVRTLILKGDALADYGLRRARRSGDVDVLVPPASFEAFESILRDFGWQARASGSLFSTHATSYYHAGWPVDIDLHHRVPGLLQSPDAVFSAIWADRRSCARAWGDFSIPDRATSALIYYLDVTRSYRPLRSTASEPERVAQYIANALPDIEERLHLAAVARTLGADWTCARLLELCGQTPGERVSVDAAVARDWELRTNKRGRVAGVALANLRLLPWARRPRAVLELVRAAPEVDGAVPPGAKTRSWHRMYSSSVRLSRGAAEWARVWIAETKRRGNGRNQSRERRWRR